MINYTGVKKSKLKFNDNYIDDMRDDPSRKVSCWMCIFSGKNDEIPVVKGKQLCVRHMGEITEVKGSGTCDEARSRFKWYNKLNPIKKWLLERDGFKFKNR